MKIIKEYYKQERQSYKFNLALSNLYTIELFSFPTPPQRVLQSEACGICHPHFEVANLEKCIEIFKSYRKIAPIL